MGKFRKIEAERDGSDKETQMGKFQDVLENV